MARYGLGLVLLLAINAEILNGWVDIYFVQIAKATKATDNADRDADSS
jgi:hypothetical protein